MKEEETKKKSELHKSGSYHSQRNTTSSFKCGKKTPKQNREMKKETFGLWSSWNFLSASQSSTTSATANPWTDVQAETLAPGEWVGLGGRGAGGKVGD